MDNYRLNGEFMIPMHLEAIQKLTTDIITCRTREEVSDLSDKLLANYESVRKHIVIMVEYGEMNPMDAVTTLVDINDAIKATAKVVANQLYIIERKKNNGGN